MVGGITFLVCRRAELPGLTVPAPRRPELVERWIAPDSLQSHEVDGPRHLDVAAQAVGESQLLHRVARHAKKCW